MVVPAEFARRIEGIHGDAGSSWLARIPQIAAEAAEKWGVVLDDPFPCLTYSWVAPGLRGKEPVVLKVVVPTEESLREPLALKAFGGSGCVRLLQLDLKSGAMLLERLVPGEMLVGNPNAVEVAASLMPELWKAPPAPSLPSLANWTRGLETNPAGIPIDILNKARELRGTLIRSSPPPVLLHGDLHHFNILSNGSGWKAIDPKGVIGEAAFECAAFLINVFPSSGKDGVRQEIDSFARRLHLDRARIVAWAAAFGVLSAIWTLEDHGTLDESALEFSTAMLGL